MSSPSWAYSVPVCVMHNTEGGYLMRTKAKDSDEGGVAAGFSSLDSLILYEEV